MIKRRILALEKQSRVPQDQTFQIMHKSCRQLAGRPLPDQETVGGQLVQSEDTTKSPTLKITSPTLKMTSPTLKLTSPTLKNNKPNLMIKDSTWGFYTFLWLLVYYVHV